MDDLYSLHAILKGHVQGVFFRAFVAEKARELQLCGYVRNLSDGNSIEIHAEGEKAKLLELIEHLKVGLPFASVDKTEFIWSKYTHQKNSFKILY